MLNRGDSAVGQDKYQTSTNTDVQNIFNKAKDLMHDSKWDIPTYDWSIERTQFLTQMPLSEVDQHLNQLIGSKFGMEKLLGKYLKDSKRLTNEFNRKIKRTETDYQEFVNLSRHPNEISYRRKYGALPEKQKINLSDITFGVSGLILSVILIFVFFKAAGVAGTAHPLLAMVIGGFSVFVFPITFIISVLFLIFAKFELPFAQPIASYKNHKREVLKNEILAADEQYRQENDCSDRALEKEFKLNDSYNSYRSNYVEQMKFSYDKVKKQLTEFANIISNEVFFFPPAQTKNIPHLLKIYEALLDGMPTWAEALKQVKQDENFQNMKNDVISAIESSSQAIMDIIEQSSSEITRRIDETNARLGGMQEEARSQTEAINYWGSKESAELEYQTAMMERRNAHVNKYGKW